MGSYNRVLIMGNLTRDIELRYTQSNQPVANIGVAVNRRYKTASGESRDETTYVDCEAWGRTAEVMSQYLQKGRPVFVEGRLKQDTWQDRDTGQNRSKMVIVVENFQFVDSRGGEGGPGGGGQQGGGSRPAPQHAGGGQGGGQPAGQPGGQPGGQAGYEPISDDDIPF